MMCETKAYLSKAERLVEEDGFPLSQACKLVNAEVERKESQERKACVARNQ